MGNKVSIIRTMESKFIANEMASHIEEVKKFITDRLTKTSNPVSEFRLKHLFEVYSFANKSFLLVPFSQFYAITKELGYQMSFNADANTNFEPVIIPMDIHLRKGQEVLPDASIDEQRELGKVINFGLLYGSSDVSLIKKSSHAKVN